MLLSAEPSVGAPVLRTRAQGVRRLHLARIRYHLYYRIRGDRVDQLTVDHSVAQALVACGALNLKVMVRSAFT